MLMEILQDRRKIDADFAERLGRYTDMTPQFWLGLQQSWDYARRVVPVSEMRHFLHVRHGQEELAPATDIRATSRSGAAA
jgi:plasmid maintenance system antidote protein VapI